MHPSPAYELTTSRLSLRCWKTADAPLLLEALQASRDHLLPWARDEVLPLGEQEEKLARFACDFAAGNDFIYGIFDQSESRVLGGTGLHYRGRVADVEIGYWLRPDAVGNGYVTESSIALVTEAFASLPVETVTIICDPLNLRSAGVPRRIGFRCLGELPTRTGIPGRTSDLVWQVTRSQWDKLIKGRVV